MKRPKRLTTSKSPTEVARVALRYAKESLDKYSCSKSRRDYTQPQLFSILILKQFFKVDYRGVIQLLVEFKELRQALELRREPHYSTLCYAHRRMLKKKNLKDYLAPLLPDFFQDEYEEILDGLELLTPQEWKRATRVLTMWNVRAKDVSQCANTPKPTSSARAKRTSS